MTTIIILQACCTLIPDMRASGMTREEAIAYTVHTVCSVEGCDPECVEYRVAYDYDGDGDVDLHDFGEFQRSGEPRAYEWFYRNAEAYCP